MQLFMKMLRVPFYWQGLENWAFFFGFDLTK